jgi:hypothetical protein
MKNACVMLFMSLISLSVSAEEIFQPHLGDFAVYGENPQISSSKIMHKISFFDANYPVVGQAYGVDVYKVNEVDQLELSYVEALQKSILEDSYISDLRSTCLKENGSIEKITVPAGDFETCKVIENISALQNFITYYAANVPFGIVKQIEVSGSESTGVTTKELIKFGFGE